MLRTVLILVYATSCIIAANTREVTSSGRIVGGTDASPDEFPHQLLLLEQGYPICGGSLLEVDQLQIILTAAHCVANGYAESYSAVAGEYDLAEESGTEQRRQISRIFIHQEYHRYENDIAILIPTEPFLLNQHVDTILLPESPEPPKGEAVVSGWGSRDPKGSETRLQKVIVGIVPEEICKANYNNSGYEIFPTMVCAGEKGKDSCQGDSGGPLGTPSELPQNDKFLYGIVSFGKGCGRKDFPGVYTRTFSYVPWIKEVVANYKKE